MLSNLIKRISVVVLISATSWLSSLTFAAENDTESIWVVGRVSEDFNHLQSDLTNIGISSADQVNRFSVNTAVVDQEELAQLLANARDAEVDNVLIITLEKDKKTQADLTVEIINATSEKTIYRLFEEMKFKEERSLLAQIEYQLPKRMKSEFKQLGHVVEIDSNVLFFDIGSTAGVEAGDVYRVFRQGKEIKGPSGESFGFIDDQTGVVQVKSVSSVYSSAELLLGRISIEKGDWVERVDANPDDYKGFILSKLDDQVAINLGKNVGITEGAYFAVYKDVKAIKEGEAFREMVGSIRVTEVFDDYARGKIAASDNYQLAKAMVNDGDYIEEVQGSGGLRYMLGQMSAGILTETKNIYVIGAELETLDNTALRYRAKVGFGSAIMASAGIGAGVNKSDMLQYGIDAVYLGGFGANLFLKVDVPTPLDRYGTLVMETGYLVSPEDEYSGLNITLGLRLNW